MSRVHFRLHGNEVLGPVPVGGAVGMEGASWVLVRRARESRLLRCRRRSSKYLPPFPLLLLLFLHLQASPSIKIYVMLHHKSPHILCVTKRLRNVELIDPTFRWHAPIGNAAPENSSVKVTESGSLIFHNFTEEMSGIYTCSLSYKRTAEELEKTLQLKYVVYAYSNPSFSYQFSVRYHSAPCGSIYNVSFEKKMLQILRKLVDDLSCEMKLLKSECHHVKMQRAGLQNELFFTFSVIPIENGTEEVDECTDSSCDPVERLDKAKSLIERFFIQQVEVLEERLEPLPEIYYIEGTLKTVWITHCNPGYGMNALVHPKCPDCCVICSPGSFNPRSGTHCLQCNISMVYGARKC
ncbi:zona pellucida-binding protein 1 isoform X2 [Notamacropus eugenii]|uniref:zona pellucida-binding protein 1 isoform X2 n=1 Tax=Notamacropus eugenii TaxID=9315 RepID=UPI003B684F72